MGMFWLVWNEDGKNPMRKHFSEESARHEAERLAKVNPEQTFHVLVRIDACKIKTVFWEVADKEADIPF